MRNVPYLLAARPGGWRLNFGSYSEWQSPFAKGKNVGKVPPGLPVRDCREIALCRIYRCALPARAIGHILPFQIAFLRGVGFRVGPLMLKLRRYAARRESCPLAAGIAKGRMAVAEARCCRANGFNKLSLRQLVRERRAFAGGLKRRNRMRPFCASGVRNHSIILRLQNLPLRKTGCRSAVCSQILRGWPALYCMSSGFARRFSGGRCGIRRRAWKNTSSHVRR